MNKNHFQIFNLPISFRMDLDKLEQAYQKVMQQIHPDRQEQQALHQRLAAQYATLVNDAYHCLKDPVSRATYLAEQQGINIDLEHRSIDDMAFLEQLMAWQEHMEDASESKDMHQLTELKAQVNHSITQQKDAFESLYNHLAQQSRAVEKAAEQPDQDTASLITDHIAKMRFSL